MSINNTNMICDNFYGQNAVSSVCTYNNEQFIEKILNKISEKNALNEASKKHTWSENGAKNVVKFIDGKVEVACKKFPNGTYVMPEIVDVCTIENNGKVKVVVVTFADGTTEKAVLSADDTYSLEYGISVCVTKRLLSGKCDGHGSSVYNKIVHHGLKVYENAEKKAAKDAEETERVKIKMAKLAQKKEEKRAKRESAEREYLIGIQAEAYIRAMRELNAPAE